MVAARLEIREQKVEWAPKIVASLDFAARKRVVVVLAFTEQRKKATTMQRREGVLPPLVAPDTLLKWLAQEFATASFPSVLIAGSEQHIAGTGHPSVQVLSASLGEVELDLSPTPDWPAAFCPRDFLKTRTGLTESGLRWRAALGHQVDWDQYVNPAPIRELVGQEGGPIEWQQFPGERTDVKYKSSSAWPLDREDVLKIIRDNWSPLLRTGSEFAFCIGVDDVTRLPLGVMVTCTAKRIAEDVGALLGTYFPPLVAESITVTLHPVVVPCKKLRQAKDSRAVAPSFCGEFFRFQLCRHPNGSAPQYIFMKKDLRGCVCSCVSEDGVDDDGEEGLAAFARAGRILYWCAEVCDDQNADDDAGDGEVVPLNVIRVAVRLTAGSRDMQALSMYNNASASALNVPTVIRRDEGHLSFVENQRFSPLLYYLRCRTSCSMERLLRQPHCTKVVLSSGPAPRYLDPYRGGLHSINVAEDDLHALFDLAAQSEERFILAVLALTEASRYRISTYMNLYCCRGVKPLQLLIIADEDDKDVTEPFLKALKVAVRLSGGTPPTKVADVVLPPPPPDDTFVRLATDHDFIVFDGRAEPWPDAELHPFIPAWLKHGGHISAEALAQGIVPTINRQEQQLLDCVTKLVQGASSGVEVMEVCQLFRCAGATTLLRQVAAQASASHHSLLFVDALTDSATWSKELIDALPHAPAPLIIVAEVKADVDLLKAASPKHLVIVLTVERILGKDASQIKPSSFLLSPFVSRRRVKDVCDSLALACPKNAASPLHLKILSLAEDDTHRHLLVFRVAALEGVELLHGIDSYVEAQLDHLLPPEEAGQYDKISPQTREFLSAIAFFGTFASATSRFFDVSSALEDDVAALQGKGSLLFRKGKQVAVWHPWVAKVLLSLLAPGALTSDMISSGLVRSLDCLYLGSACKETLMRDLLFTRGGHAFSPMITRYAGIATAHDIHTFPIDDLAETIPRSRKESRPAFRAHCHVLLSRICRTRTWWDLAEEHAQSAVEGELSYSTQQNQVVVALYAARDRGEAVDKVAMERALRDLAMLSSLGDKECRRKALKTARTFASLDVWTDAERERIWAMFGPPGSMPQKVVNPRKVTRKYAKRNMPAMKEATLERLLLAAQTVECY